MSSILKSSALIESIKVRGFIPESQETFKPEHFLSIATEKLNIAIMKQLMSARGDYLIYFEDVPLVDGQSEYPLPDRAHGNKLRDCCIVDGQGNVEKELTQVSLDELSDYRTQRSANYNGTLEPFYLQNNNVCLVKDIRTVGRFLRMYFYMRPNKLVLESRAITATQLSSTFEVDNISPLTGVITAISLGSVITSPNHGLTSGQYILITGSDSDPEVDGIQQVVVVDENNFTVAVPITIPGSVGSWALAAPVCLIPSMNFPKHFTSDLLYDVVSFKSPNQIKMYNIPANAINNSLKTISFRIADVGTKIAKGDYITQAEESIVPNIPTEFHPLLAQMVSVHCMESMADEQQKQSANKTLKEMEQDILGIVSNRVEGAPKKIKNRHGTLMQSRNRRGY